jgi:hypothetical protein
VEGEQTLASQEGNEMEQVGFQTCTFSQVSKNSFFNISFTSTLHKQAE